jgi:hypothetical protein
MKRSINLEFGEGLFADEFVPVEIEFLDHTATFFMTALTGDVIAELAKDGVKLDEAALRKMNEGQQAAQAKKLMAKFVHGWEGFQVCGEEIPFTEKARDQIAVTEALGDFVLIAKDLGVVRQKEEEKNSEDSSAGTSEPVTSH